jgi:hypothetical protein
MTPVEVATMAEGLSLAALLTLAQVWTWLVRRNTVLDARRRHSPDRPGAVPARALVLRETPGEVVSHRADRRPAQPPVPALTVTDLRVETA